MGLRKFAAVMTAALAGFILFCPCPARSGCCLSPGKVRGLVDRFAPLLVQEPSIPADPEKVLFRASTDDDCRRLYIAYHVVWPFERDPRPGLWPALTRTFYTDVFKLQRLMYGKGDVEVIEITVDLATEQPVRIKYETADYDKKGNVIHRDVTVAKDGIPSIRPLAFEAVSWNHMFELLEEPPGPDRRVFRLSPQPFSDELWKSYRMTKKHRVWPLKDRAHPPWEDGAICPVEPARVCSCGRKP